MSELVVVCVECGDEFAESDGWLDRCAMCCALRDDHLSGLHTAIEFGCLLCEAADDKAVPRTHVA